MESHRGGPESPSSYLEHPETSTSTERTAGKGERSLSAAKP